ncbi:MAG: hypothetical protein ACE149_00060 [Armatimonadota bacterium]
MGWRNHPTPALALSGCALSLLCWAFAHTDRTLAMRPRMLVLFFSAFAVFLAAVFAIRRARAELPRHLVWLIVLVGIGLRLAVAPVRPATTSDIYRYLWEGRVVRAGLNPYAEAPNSPRLAHLRDWVWDVLPFKSVPAAYPPVAQYVFAAAGLVPGPPVIVLKLMLALFDIGTVLLLVSLFAAMKLPRCWVILYAWHPLAICELVARGHLDTIGIFFMALALRLLPVARPCERSEQRRRLLPPTLSAAALTLSILSKGYALVIAPFFVIAARPRRWVFVLAMAATAALVYAPFASAGLDLFRGAAMYGRGWRGNSSVFALLDIALSPISLHHNVVARAICLVLLVVWVVALVGKAMLAPAPKAGIGVPALHALIGLFLLSPAVYPWYLAWTLPLLCVAIAAKHTAGDTLLPHVSWLLLTGTIFGFYAHDLAGHHREIWWVTTAEYAVPIAAAVVGWAWRRAADRGDPEPPLP